MATGHLPLSPHRRTEAQQQLFNELTEQRDRARGRQANALSEAEIWKRKVEALDFALNAMMKAE